MSKSKPKPKKEAKSEAPSDAKPEKASDAKPEKASDANSESKSDSTSDSAGDNAKAPADYSRGENQKAVTKTYRKNWDAVFGGKRKGRRP